MLPMKKCRGHGKVLCVCTKLFEWQSFACKDCVVCFILWGNLAHCMINLPSCSLSPLTFHKHEGKELQLHWWILILGFFIRGSELWKTLQLNNMKNKEQEEKFLKITLNLCPLGLDGQPIFIHLITFNNTKKPMSTYVEMVLTWMKLIHVDRGRWFSPEWNSCM